jgi:hypothetical protein
MYQICLFEFTTSFFFLLWKKNAYFRAVGCFIFSSFPLGSFSLCFRKHLSLMAYFTIPSIGLPNLLYQFRAATPPKQRNAGVVTL